MRVRIVTIVFVSVFATRVAPAIAQPPTCTTSGATMNCTFTVSSGNSPWAVNGNNITNINSGNVGVGTATPDFPFTIHANVDAFHIDSNTSNYTFLHSTVAGASPIDMNNQGGSLRIFAGGSERIRLDTSGRVGIGTSSPQTSLDVNGPMSLSNGNQIFFRNAAGTLDTNIREGVGGNLDIVGPVAGQVFFSNHADSLVNVAIADNGQTVFIGSGNVGIGTPNPASKLHVVGNVYVTGTITAGGYQDVAEWVPARRPLAAGTVVVASDGGAVEASKRAYDTAVLGVVSPQPGLVLGEPGPDKALVSQSGRVRVKVDASYGEVRVGDLLVTSPEPGVAMKSEPLNVGGATFHRPGTLLGKALEPLARGEGQILVLLTLQ